MTLEHCHSTGYPVEFEVTMGYRQRRFPVAHARNLSPQGIYVQIANLTLPPGTLIEIEFDRWGRRWLIPAIVVYGDTHGFRLKFQTPQPELYRYAKTAPAAPRSPVAGDC